ncbi:RNA polymerase factor sigma-54 [Tenuifilum thalassicum]|uniref:RNA polymerase factor sigma-54 n=1 Tax=Tenuifilum thalassicum TaxID=2590900 RepID=A0A7D4BQM5_9BACT|nr:RNA polymerase factor sigma-54 [Tenuifilum thalassicum]QKG78901.1 RNA polymerase factor sigma-54 [Tenuifilum thalassicum]
MLKQRLQQKLLQKLSPQQIQMIKLLEIPTMLLEQRIKKELEENPILEEVETDEPAAEPEMVLPDDNKEGNDDEFSLEDYMNDDDVPTYKLYSNNSSYDDKREEIPFSTGVSFHDYLENQLGMADLSEHEKQLGLYLIGNIDGDGYIRRKLSAIADDIAFSLGIETNEDELERILWVIQEFDPPGVGARDLQECLLIQIKAKENQNKATQNAYKILKYHFDEFIKKHYDKISSRLNLSDDELKEAIDEILKLNPKPGGSFTDPYDQSAQHIIPDFILEYEDGEFRLSLNSKNVPELRISKEYSDMIENYSYNKEFSTTQEREAIAFVKQKIDSAKWFIDALKQRQNTLLTTMEAILDYQKEYFRDGDESKLKPMILKDIAERTGLDISTISRVANSKYIQTHFGIFPLKHFFSEGMQTDSGEQVSTREIKQILAECVENEDKKKPLTDEQLMEILKSKGYPIARRTVAKYREQLGIPVARLRKELN